MKEFTAVQRKLSTASVGLVLTVAAGAASASGFQIYELSAAASGNAMAGATAGAENISYMAFNPAAIGRLEGTRFSISGAFIMPQFEVNNAVAGYPALPFPGSLPGDSSAEAGENAFVPSLYAKWDLAEDVSFGIAITAPWGLTTEYDNDWVGRYHAIKSELTTININPVVAFHVTPNLILAGGLVAQYAEATLSRAVDVGTQAALPPAPNPPFAAVSGKHDVYAEVTGDGWAYGFNLGLLWQLSEQTRVGLAYESEINHFLEGEVDYSPSNSPIAKAVVGTKLQDSNASAGISTPATVSAGIFHQLSDHWQLMANLSWTDWSSFDQLRVNFMDSTQPDSITRFEWEDTFMVSAGANYLINSSWKLRAGVGYDEAPVPDAEHRSPRLPDSDRTWLAAGLTWDVSKQFSVSASYAHVFLDNATIDIPAGNNKSSLTADTEGSADILSAQVSWRF